MTQVATLLQSLGAEITDEKRLHMAEFIGHLYLYIQKRDATDGDDLLIKLTSANREGEIPNAEISLEQFEMLIEEYKHYPSGQKLFGFFLAQVHDVFCHKILNQTPVLTSSEVDKIIQVEIIDKTISDMGAGFEHFTLTHRHIRGMVYYLADRCFIRWDKKCSV